MCSSGVQLVLRERGERVAEPEEGAEIVRAELLGGEPLQQVLAGAVQQVGLVLQGVPAQAQQLRDKIRVAHDLLVLFGPQQRLERHAYHKIWL